MAFEPKFEEIQTTNKRKIDTLATSCNVSMQTNGEKIKKVLFKKSFLCVNKVSKNGNLAVVEGVANVFALVLTEEGSFLPLKAYANFSANFSLNEQNADCQLFCTTQNLGVSNISANEITLNLTQKIEIELFCAETSTTKIVSSIEPANQKLQTLEYESISNVFSENFDLNTELELPNSISKVLFADSFVLVKNATSSADMTTINGTLHTNLFYLTSDEVPKIKSKTYATDFTQEILTNGTLAEQNVVCDVFVCNNECEVEGELDGLKGVVVLKTHLKANILLFTKKSFENVIDAFCVRKELEMQFSNFLSSKVVCTKNFSDKIDGSYVLGENETRLDKILLATDNGITLNAEVFENDINVKGQVFVNVVYLLDDEEHTMKVSTIPLNFDTSVQCDDLKQGDVISVKPNLKDVEARIKKSKEIDVVAELVLQIVVEREEADVVMTNLIVGGSREQKQSNLAIFVVNQAKDLWEISKLLLVNPEMLEKQNPDLKFPIEKPTQIVVYRGKQA